MSRSECCNSNSDIDLFSKIDLEGESKTEHQ